MRDLRRTKGEAVNRWADRDRLALVGAVLAPGAVALALVPLRTHFANADAALVLVLVVVAIAANGYRRAGVLAALSAAVSFDFLLTRPYEQLTIAHAGDVETTVLLLAVGAGVSELAARGRRLQALVSKEAGYLDGIRAAADVMATGKSIGALIDNACLQLRGALELRGCRFQEGVAGMGEPPRLQRDGQVTWRRANWNVDRDGLPADQELELLVEHHGRLYGRFMLDVAPGRRLSLLERRVAVTLADQVGAALN